MNQIVIQSKAHSQAHFKDNIEFIIFLMKCQVPNFIIMISSILINDLDHCKTVNRIK